MYLTETNIAEVMVEVSCFETSAFHGEDLLSSNLFVT